MKFVHLITRNHAVLTTCAISFLSEPCFKKNHSLCTISFNNVIRNDINTNNIPNFDIKNKKNVLQYIRLFNYLNKFDFVILHGMYISRLAFIFLMIFKPQLLKKIVWIGYGQDVHELDKIHSKSIFENLKIYFYKKCYTKIKAFIGIFPPDVDLYKNKIKRNIPCFYAPYSFVKDEYFTQNYVPHESLIERHSSNKPIRILIGHRGASFLNHTKWINELKRFKNENIEIYIPLFNAQEKYFYEISNLAYAEFNNDKIIILDKFIPYNQLIELTKRIDIAIIDSNFQVALGTLYLLFFHGTKVFLPSTSIMYNTFKSNNIPIQNLDFLCKMDFNELIKDIDMKPAYNYVKNIKNYDNTITMWQNIFTQIESII